MGTALRRELMTIIEAAKKLGLTKWAIYKQIKNGNGIGPKFFKKGKSWVIDGRNVK
jgi:hypothetical protein